MELKIMDGKAGQSAHHLTLKVLDILASSKELVDFLREVDTAYHSKQSGPSSLYGHSVNKYVPSFREQLQDWEDGLCESDADGSFLHENWNHDLRLFNDGEDGAPKLLQLFVLRAEHEIKAKSGDLQNIDSIQSKMSVLFGGPIRASYTSSPVKEPHDPQQSRGEVFTPKHPGHGKRTWDDVKYKGDWMRRPIADSEVAWLALILIRLSDWLNEVLGLDRVDDIEPCGLTYVDLPRDETVGYIRTPKEACLMVAYLIGSRVSFLLNSSTRFLRGHGMRINLRVLASKKLVMVLVVYAFICALKKALCAAIIYN